MGEEKRESSHKHRHEHSHEHSNEHSNEHSHKHRRKHRHKHSHEHSHEHSHKHRRKRSHEHGHKHEEVSVDEAMGFAGFGSTKDQQVKGNIGTVAKITKAKRYRQYMNRKGGFNRPLDSMR